MKSWLATTLLIIQILFIGMSIGLAGYQILIYKGMPIEKNGKHYVTQGGITGEISERVFKESQIRTRVAFALGLIGAACSPVRRLVRKSVPS